MEIIQLFHPVAIVAVVVTGVIRGCSGFGVGFLLTPTLSLVYDAPTAVVMVVLLDVPAIVYLLRFTWPYTDWHSVRWISLGCVLGVPIGVYLLITIDPILMRRLIGFFALAFTAILASGFRIRSRVLPGAAVAIGVAAGGLGGATALPGPPIILYFLSGPYTAREARANITMLFAVLEVALIAWFIWHGLIDRTILLRCAALAPIYFAAIWVGNKMFGLVSETIFRRIAYVLIGMVALSALLL